MNKGLVHIYTGEGKGKTCCAMGTALRAVGNGLMVRIFQFCKAEPSGEIGPLDEMPTLQVRCAAAKTTKFVRDMTPEEKQQWCQAQQALFDVARQTCQDKDIDMVILDEAFFAMHEGALTEAQLRVLIDRKNPGTELILTGRGAPQSLIDLADYVTEMRMVKHPYNEGQAARRGIEY